MVSRFRANGLSRTCRAPPSGDDPVTAVGLVGVAFKLTMPPPVPMPIVMELKVSSAKGTPFTVVVVPGCSTVTVFVGLLSQLTSKKNPTNRLVQAGARRVSRPSSRGRQDRPRPGRDARGRRETNDDHQEDCMSRLLKRNGCEVGVRHQAHGGREGTNAP